MKNINICNGVDLHIIQVPKFKTNLMSVYFNIPMKRETVTRAALLPSVLKRGCIKYPTLRDISRRLDDLYSASLSTGIRVKGDGEVLYFTSEYISDKYTGENLTLEIAEFLRDFIFNPLTENGGFLNNFLESEKINLKNAILGLINDKKEYAEFRCREEMFDKQGYGMCEAGYIEDFDEITPASLFEFYSHILKTAKVDVFISGDINDEAVNTVINTICKYFKPRNASYISSEIAHRTRTELKKITENADVVQSKLCMGLCCGVDPVSDEYHSLMLASCIFGGSPFSKLFNNVREKLSLAYYAVARTSKLKSVMMISSGIQTENFKAAYDEIMTQFVKMQTGEIDDSEIIAAKKYLTNALNSMNDSLRSMEDYYLSQAIMGTAQSIDDVIACINKVEKNQISDVMKKVEFDTVYFLKGNSEKEGE